MKNKKMFIIILLATLLGGLLTTQFAYAATFGQTNDYATFQSLNDYILGSVFTGGDGTAQSIWAYLDPSGISDSSTSFGYTGESVTSPDHSIKDVIRGQELYRSGSDTYTVQNIKAYIQCQGTHKMKAAIYDSSGNLIAESNEVSVPHIRVWESGAYVYYPGWRTFTFSSTTITGGNTYRLVVWSEDAWNYAKLMYRTRPHADGFNTVYESSMTYGSYPATATFSDFINREYCLYATLTKPGSANVKTAILTSSGTWVAGSNDVPFSGTDNPGWYEFPLTTNPTITSSTDYLLAAWSDGDVEISSHDYSTQGVSQSATYDGWPSLTPSSTDSEYSIYCSYTENEDPVADADGPYEVVHGSSVQLDGSASYDPDGSIVLWEWDLDNDGTYDASGVTVTHTYPSIATYPVTLRVTDDGGATDKDTSTVTVSPEVQRTGTITVHKWHDMDEDIDWDPGEPGLSGWVIVLEDENHNELASGVTDGSGAITFSGLPFGSYYLREVGQNGWYQTYPDGSEYFSVTLTQENPTKDNVRFGNAQRPDFVVPEYPFGTILSILTMMTALILSQNKHKIQL